MTRKDYRLLAEAMRTTRPLAARRTARRQWAYCVAELAWVLETHYPGFDPETFLAACAKRKD